MALHEKTGGDGNFLLVKHHALCLESKEPKEGYVETIVNNPSTNQDVTKYIKKFGSVDGFITKIEWYERADGGNTYRGIKILLKDRTERYSLDLPFEKRHFDYFTKVAENIDYAEPVEFCAWKDRQDERVTAFGVKQNGDFVKWKYTKEDMGDCPIATQLRSGKWNFTDQREWLLERLITVVIPHVDKITAFDEPQPEYAGEELAATATAGLPAPRPKPANDDDIPF